MRVNKTNQVSIIDGIMIHLNVNRHVRTEEGNEYVFTFALAETGEWPGGSAAAITGDVTAVASDEVVGRLSGALIQRKATAGSFAGGRKEADEWRLDSGDDDGEDASCDFPDSFSLAIDKTILHFLQSP